MALSGSFSGSIISGHYKVKVDWTATQSVANNTSKITCNMYLVNDWDLSINGRSDHTITIDGTTYKLASNEIRSTGTHYIGSCTKTVTHNADGSRKVSLLAAFQFRATINGTYYESISASTTITLDTIPRASSFSVSKTSADMGTEVTFTITRAASAFTHTLLLTMGGKTSTIASGIATSRAWTIPLTLANDLPNSTSSGCVITCVTYNGSTEIGRKTLTMTLTVPSSIKPNIDSVTISEATDGLAAKFGAYVQHKSKLKVVTAASGSYSSTIKSYSVKILNKTYSGNTITSDILALSGSINVNVTVTDSRGRTASVSETVTVLAYSDPKITAFTVDRCDSDGAINDEGEYVRISYAFDVTSLSDKNDKSYIIGYKLKTDSDFTTLIGGSAYSLSTTHIPDVIFSGDNAYDFIITVTDYFKSVSHIDDISTAFTLVDYHSSGTGMAIGKVSEKQDTLEIALDVEFTGKVRGAIFDAIYPVGSIYLAYNHVNPANLFGGTWTRIENAFLWASTASDTIGVTGGEKTHTLTVNEMPRHKHNVGAYKSTDGNGSTLDSYTALVSTSNGADTTSKYYTSGTLSTGGSQPHNNMPPYIQVSIWRRIA